MARKHRKKAREIKLKEAKEKKSRRRTEFDFDLWQEEEGDKKCSLEDDWISAASKDAIKDRSKVNLPKDLREKTSNLKAVSLPQGGSSYNPSFKDHQVSCKRLCRSLALINCLNRNC